MGRRATDLNYVNFDLLLISFPLLIFLNYSTHQWNFYVLIFGTHASKDPAYTGFKANLANAKSATVGCCRFNHGGTWHVRLLSKLNLLDRVDLIHQD
jgi:hypothetical protein